MLAVMGRLPQFKVDVLLLALTILTIFLIKSSQAAPVDESPSDPRLGGKGCYYLNKLHSSGDQIETNEPCLNCTCIGSTLMCYLRVCPYVKPLGSECRMEKHVGECCPQFWCPEVYPRSTTEKPDDDVKGCYLEDKYYDDGARIPMNPANPCEVCYCIRNTSVCTMQECELQVDGCFPEYKPGSCCPSRYNCTEEAATTIPPHVMEPHEYEGCRFEGIPYNDGDKVPTMDNCQTCYCMKNEVVCANQKCTAPADDCVPLETEPGQCCPEKYECPNATAADETTTLSFTSTIAERTSIGNVTIERISTIPELRTVPELTPTGLHLSTFFTAQDSEETTAHMLTKLQTDEVPTTTPTAKSILTTITDAVSEILTSTTLAQDAEVSELVTEAPAASNTTLTVADLVSRPREAKITEVPDDMFTSPKATGRPVFYPKRVPGEGICRHGNNTYQSHENVFTGDPCLKNCVCINSVVKCEKVECLLTPPESRERCKVKTLPGECCPKYFCDISTTKSPEAEETNYTRITPSDQKITIVSLDETTESVITSEESGFTREEIKTTEPTAVTESIIKDSTAHHTTTPTTELFTSSEESKETTESGAVTRFDIPSSTKPKDTTHIAATTEIIKEQVTSLSTGDEMSSVSELDTISSVVPVVSTSTVISSEETTKLLVTDESKTGTESFESTTEKIPKITTDITTPKSMLEVSLAITSSDVSHLDSTTLETMTPYTSRDTSVTESEGKESSAESLATETTHKTPETFEVSDTIDAITTSEIKKDFTTETETMLDEIYKTETAITDVQEGATVSSKTEETEKLTTLDKVTTYVESETVLSSTLKSTDAKQTLTDTDSKMKETTLAEIATTKVTTAGEKVTVYDGIRDSSVSPSTLTISDGEKYTSLKISDVEIQTTPISLSTEESLLLTTESVPIELKTITVKSTLGPSLELTKEKEDDAIKTSSPAETSSVTGTTPAVPLKSDVKPESTTMKIIETSMKVETDTQTLKEIPITYAQTSEATEIDFTATASSSTESVTVKVSEDTKILDTTIIAEEEHISTKEQIEAEKTKSTETLLAETSTIEYTPSEHSTSIPPSSTGASKVDISTTTEFEVLDDEKITTKRPLPDIVDKISTQTDTTTKEPSEEYKTTVLSDKSTEPQLGTTQSQSPTFTMEVEITTTTPEISSLKKDLTQTSLSPTTEREHIPKTSMEEEGQTVGETISTKGFIVTTASKMTSEDLITTSSMEDIESTVTTEKIKDVPPITLEIIDEEKTAIIQNLTTVPSEISTHRTTTESTDVIEKDKVTVTYKQATETEISDEKSSISVSESKNITKASLATTSQDMEAETTSKTTPILIESNLTTTVKIDFTSTVTTTTTMPDAMSTSSDLILTEQEDSLTTMLESSDEDEIKVSPKLPLSTHDIDSDMETTKSLYTEYSVEIQRNITQIETKAPVTTEAVIETKTSTISSQTDQEGMETPTSTQTLNISKIDMDSINATAVSLDYTSSPELLITKEIAEPTDTPLSITETSESDAFITTEKKEIDISLMSETPTVDTHYLETTKLIDILDAGEVKRTSLSDSERGTTLKTSTDFVSSTESTMASKETVSTLAAFSITEVPITDSTIRISLDSTSSTSDLTSKQPKDEFKTESPLELKDRTVSMELTSTTSAIISESETSTSKATETTEKSDISIPTTTSTITGEQYSTEAPSKLTTLSDSRITDKSTFVSDVDIDTLSQTKTTFEGEQTDDDLKLTEIILSSTPSLHTEDFTEKTGIFSTTSQAVSTKLPTTTVGTPISTIKEVTEIGSTLQFTEGVDTSSEDNITITTSEVTPEKVDAGFDEPKSTIIPKHKITEEPSSKFTVVPPSELETTTPEFDIRKSTDNDRLDYSDYFSEKTEDVSLGEEEKISQTEKTLGFEDGKSISTQDIAKITESTIITKETKTTTAVPPSVTDHAFTKTSMYTDISSIDSIFTSEPITIDHTTIEKLTTKSEREGETTVKEHFTSKEETTELTKSDFIPKQNITLSTTGATPVDTESVETKIFATSLDEETKTPIITDTITKSYHLTTEFTEPSTPAVEIKDTEGAAETTVTESSLITSTTSSQKENMTSTKFTSPLLEISSTEISTSDVRPIDDEKTTLITRLDAQEVTASTSSDSKSIISTTVSSIDTPKTSSETVDQTDILKTEATVIEMKESATKSESTKLYTDVQSTTPSAKKEVILHDTKEATSVFEDTSEISVTVFETDASDSVESNITSTMQTTKEPSYSKKTEVSFDDLDKFLTTKSFTTHTSEELSEKSITSTVSDTPFQTSESTVSKIVVDGTTKESGERTKWLTKETEIMETETTHRDIFTLEASTPKPDTSSETPFTPSIDIHMFTKLEETDTSSEFPLNETISVTEKTEDASSVAFSKTSEATEITTEEITSKTDFDEKSVSVTVSKASELTDVTQPLKSDSTEMEAQSTFPSIKFSEDFTRSTVYDSLSSAVTTMADELKEVGTNITEITKTFETIQTSSVFRETTAPEDSTTEGSLISKKELESTLSSITFDKTDASAESILTTTITAEKTKEIQESETRTPVITTITPTIEAFEPHTVEEKMKSTSITTPREHLPIDAESTLAVIETRVTVPDTGVTKLVSKVAYTTEEDIKTTTQKAESSISELSILSSTEISRQKEITTERPEMTTDITERDFEITIVSDDSHKSKATFGPPDSRLGTFSTEHSITTEHFETSQAATVKPFSLSELDRAGAIATKAEATDKSTIKDIESQSEITKLPTTTSTFSTDIKIDEDLGVSKKEIDTKVTVQESSTFATAEIAEFEKDLTSTEPSEMSSEHEEVKSTHSTTVAGEELLQETTNASTLLHLTTSLKTELPFSTTDEKLFTTEIPQTTTDATLTDQVKTSSIKPEEFTEDTITLKTEVDSSETASSTTLSEISTVTTSQKIKLTTQKVMDDEESLTSYKPISEVSPKIPLSAVTPEVMTPESTDEIFTEITTSSSLDALSTDTEVYKTSTIISEDITTKITIPGTITTDEKTFESSTEKAETITSTYFEISSKSPELEIKSTEKHLITEEEISEAELTTMSHEITEESKQTVEKEVSAVPTSSLPTIKSKVEELTISATDTTSTDVKITSQPDFKVTSSDSIDEYEEKLSSASTPTEEQTRYTKPDIIDLKTLVDETTKEEVMEASIATTLSPMAALDGRKRTSIPEAFTSETHISSDATVPEVQNQTVISKFGDQATPEDLSTVAHETPASEKFTEKEIEEKDSKTTSATTDKTETKDFSSTTERSSELPQATEQIFTVTESTSSTATTTVSEEVTSIVDDKDRTSVSIPSMEDTSFVSIHSTLEPQVSETTLPPIKNKCFINGTEYEDGAAISTLESCEKCSCSEGEIICFKIICKLPKTGCSALSYDINECCPITFECPTDEGTTEIVSITSTEVTAKDLSTPIPISFMFSQTPFSTSTIFLTTESESAPKQDVTTHVSLATDLSTVSPGSELSSDETLTEKQTTKTAELTSVSESLEDTTSSKTTEIILETGMTSLSPESSSEISRSTLTGSEGTTEKSQEAETTTHEIKTTTEFGTTKESKETTQTEKSIEETDKTTPLTTSDDKLIISEDKTQTQATTTKEITDLHTTKQITSAETSKSESEDSLVDTSTLQTVKSTQSSSAYTTTKEFSETEAVTPTHEITDAISTSDESIRPNTETEITEQDIVSSTTIIPTATGLTTATEKILESKTTSDTSSTTESDIDKMSVDAMEKEAASTKTSAPGTNFTTISTILDKLPESDSMKTSTVSTKIEEMTEFAYKSTSDIVEMTDKTMKAEITTDGLESTGITDSEITDKAEKVEITTDSLLISTKMTESKVTEKPEKVETTTDISSMSTGMTGSKVTDMPEKAEAEEMTVSSLFSTKRTETEVTEKIEETEATTGSSLISTRITESDLRERTEKVKSTTDSSLTSTEMTEFKVTESAKTAEEITDTSLISTAMGDSKVTEITEKSEAEETTFSSVTGIGMTESKAAEETKKVETTTGSYLTSSEITESKTTETVSFLTSTIIKESEIPDGTVKVEATTDSTSIGITESKSAEITQKAEATTDSSLISTGITESKLTEQTEKVETTTDSTSIRKETTESQIYQTQSTKYKETEISTKDITGTEIPHTISPSFRPTEKEYTSSKYDDFLDTTTQDSTLDKKVTLQETVDESETVFGEDVSQKSLPISTKSELITEETTLEAETEKSIITVTETISTNQTIPILSRKRITTPTTDEENITEITPKSDVSADTLKPDVTRTRTMEDSSEPSTSTVTETTEAISITSIADKVFTFVSTRFSDLLSETSTEFKVTDSDTKSDATTVTSPIETSTIFSDKETTGEIISESVETKSDAFTSITTPVTTEKVTTKHPEHSSISDVHEISTTSGLSSTLEEISTMKTPVIKSTEKELTSETTLTSDVFITEMNATEKELQTTGISFETTALSEEEKQPTTEPKKDTSISFTDKELISTDKLDTSKDSTIYSTTGSSVAKDFDTSTITEKIIYTTSPTALTELKTTKITEKVETGEDEIEGTSESLKFTGSSIKPIVEDNIKKTTEFVDLTSVTEVQLGSSETLSTQPAQITTLESETPSVIQLQTISSIDDGLISVRTEKPTKETTDIQESQTTKKESTIISTTETTPSTKELFEISTTPSFDNFTVKLTKSPKSEEEALTVTTISTLEAKSAETVVPTKEHLTTKISLLAQTTTESHTNVSSSDETTTLKTTTPLELHETITEIAMESSERTTGKTVTSGITEDKSDTTSATSATETITEITMESSESTTGKTVTSGMTEDKSDTTSATSATETKRPSSTVPPTSSDLTESTSELSTEVMKDINATETITEKSDSTEASAKTEETEHPSKITTKSTTITDVSELETKSVTESTKTPITTEGLDESSEISDISTYKTSSVPKIETTGTPTSDISKMPTTPDILETETRISTTGIIVTNLTDGSTEITELPTKAYKAIETTPISTTTEEASTRSVTDFLLDEGACIFDGRIYQSAEQILRDDPCEFCFCFRGDIICLQQTCPPPAANCHRTEIPGYCCPRYDCPVLVTSKNITSLSRRKGIQPIIIQKRIEKRSIRLPQEVKGCDINGTFYEVGSTVTSASWPCLHCACEDGGNMHCDPRKCKPQSPLMLNMKNNLNKTR